MRLQRALAMAGYGSRRGCEEFIRAGRVRVNGALAVIGTTADPERDEIRVDGQPLRFPTRSVTVALHKPVGVLTSLRSQGGRTTVAELVNLPDRLFPVGRLDLESEGLVLLTNDGDLANRLTHPRYGHEKEYRVLVDRRPDASQLDAWRHGVVLADGARTAPAQVWMESSAGPRPWLRVVLREGRKRQLRETAARLGLQVQRLVRVRIGSLQLGRLRSGEWRVLRTEEVDRLRGIRATVGGRPRGKPRGGHAVGTERER
jgi:23S rRNA pseudouridine2605 synthase